MTNRIDCQSHLILGRDGNFLAKLVHIKRAGIARHAAKLSTNITGDFHIGRACINSNIALFRCNVRVLGDSDTTFVIKGNIVPGSHNSRIRGFPTLNLGRFAIKSDGTFDIDSAGSCLGHATGVCTRSNKCALVDYQVATHLDIGIAGTADLQHLSITSIGAKRHIALHINVGIIENHLTRPHGQGTQGAFDLQFIQRGVVCILDAAHYNVSDGGLDNQIISSRGNRAEFHITKSRRSDGRIGARCISTGNGTGHAHAILAIKRGTTAQHNTLVGGNSAPGHDIRVILHSHIGGAGDIHITRLRSHVRIGQRVAILGLGGIGGDVDIPILRNKRRIGQRVVHGTCSHAKVLPRDDIRTGNGVALGCGNLNGSVRFERGIGHILVHAIGNPDIPTCFNPGICHVTVTGSGKDHISVCRQSRTIGHTNVVAALVCQFHVSALCDQSTPIHGQLS